MVMREADLLWDADERRDNVEGAGGASLARARRRRRRRRGSPGSQRQRQ